VSAKERTLPAVCHDGRSGLPRVAAVGSCPICEARDSTLLFRSPDHLCRVPGEFTYRRCRQCRTVFQDPQVVAEDIPLCYPDGYYTHASQEGGVATQDDQRTVGRRLGWLRDGLRGAIVRAVREPRQQEWLRGPGAALASVRGLRERTFFGLLDELIPRRPGVVRALDVGCGAGGLMVTLALAGWAVEGLDLDPIAAGIARRTSRAKVTVGDLLTADLPEGAFHLVVLGHVFEHLADPHAALRRISRLLASGGKAVLIYPNPEGLGARLFGDLWAGWEPPRHLVIPPAEALRLAAVRNGLQVMSDRTANRHFGGFSWRVDHVGEAAQPGPIRELVSWLAADVFLKCVSDPLRWLGVNMGEEVVLALTKAED